MTILANTLRELDELDKIAGRPEPIDTDRPEENDNGESDTWPEDLDEAAFYGLAGEIVRLIEPHTEADPAALLIQALVAFGSIVGRGPHIRVEGDEHHANMFAVIVGQSAKARKGTSWGRIRRMFEMVRDEWAERRVQSGLSSGEGVIWAVRDPVNDEDPGVDDKRLMLVESEFAGLLRVMARDGNIVSRIVRDAWDRGDLQTLTKNSPARATGAYISIVGHITKDELVRYLDRTEAANGFANRFLYVASRRSKLLPFGGTLKDSDMAQVVRRLVEAIQAARRVKAAAMNERAKLIWERVYPVLSADHPGMFGSITARAEAQALRLALVYALLDGSPEIGPEHLKAALAVWEYSASSARYVFGNVTGDPVIDALLQALRQAGPDGMSRTDISNLFRRHKSSQRIDRALKALAKAGNIECGREQTQGRTAEIWYSAGMRGDA